MKFAGTQILFLSASFFGYEKAIVKRLEELGATVDFFDERPSNSVFSKGIIRVKRKWYSKQISDYYKHIFQHISEKSYDYFLLIKGESIPADFLEKFKKKFPKTQMIYYSYDAFSEYPQLLNLLPFFQKKITFEPSDAKNYRLEFRPLFFLQEYLKEKNAARCKYDLTFIGSTHTDRYLVGEKVKTEAGKLGLRTFFYYYSPGKWAFIMKRFFDKNFKKFDLKKVSFKEISHAEISEIYDNSKAILDINKPFQSGLTMRTFESLASGNKLITTNTDIVNYPFFNSDNIMVINRKCPVLIKEFFEKPTIPIKDVDLEKMSLDSWLDAVFFENQSAYWFQNFQ